MRKVLPLPLLCLVLMAATAHAQQSEKFDPAKDKEELHGYVIRLLPVPGNTFGFSVVKGKTVVWSQTNNPFQQSQSGFLHKQDAYKLAEWVVNEHEKNSRAPIQFTPAVAQQLNLSTDLPKH